MSANRRGHTLRDLPTWNSKPFGAKATDRMVALQQRLHARMVDDKCGLCSRNIDIEERRHIVSGYIREDGSEGDMLVCVTCTPDDGKWSWVPFLQACG